MGHPLFDLLSSGQGNQTNPFTDMNQVLLQGLVQQFPFQVPKQRRRQVLQGSPAPDLGLGQLQQDAGDPRFGSGEGLIMQLIKLFAAGGGGAG